MLLTLPALAGVGAGVTAAGATGNWLVRVVSGAAGGVLLLLASYWAEGMRASRKDKAAAVRARTQVLDVPARCSEQDSTVLGMLLPTRKDAPAFRGRTADLAWLERWLHGPTAHPVAAVTGPAGVGKTRLAVQVASALPASWVKGWLRPGSGPTALRQLRTCADPVLVLVDDADGRPDLEALLEDLADDRGGPPIRVLLIVRTAEAFAPIAARLPDPQKWILASDKMPVRKIEAFGSEEDHVHWYREAVKAYAAIRHTPPPDLPGGARQRIAGAKDEPILALHARALLAVLDCERHRPGHRRASVMPFDQVAEALFAHEQRRWREIADQADGRLTDLAAVVQDRAVAALMLASATDEVQAVTALRWVPNLADASAERLANIARWALSLYPSDSSQAINVQPDMLAEWFIVNQLARTPQFISHLGALTQTQVLSLLALLAHASDHMPDAAPLYANVILGDPISRVRAGVTTALTAGPGRLLLDGALASLVTKTSWPAGSLRELDRQIPPKALPRTRAAISHAIVENARENHIEENLANALRIHSVRLSELGRYREGLTFSQEALALWRDLAAANSVHLPDFARALHSRGLCLSELGRHQEALADNEEALALWRDLAAANSVHLPDLARALHSQSTYLRDLGRYQESLTAVEAVTVMFQGLAVINSVHLPDLARTLHSRGLCLSELGRHQEALADNGEALALWRDLAAANSVHLPDLARALHSQSTYLGDLGRYQEGLAAAGGALAMWRNLAIINPALRSYLAQTLQIRSVYLAILGSTQEALANNEEALTLYRDLAAANPVHLPDLARTLNSRGVSLSNSGLHQEALAAIDKALTLRRGLVASNPAHRPSLANTLQNRYACLQRLGRSHEALADGKKALALYQRLAATNPCQYRRHYHCLLYELRRIRDLEGSYAMSAGLHLTVGGA
jgi:tetratricopeptide (TPR) repeat protein